jgi:hypothetical protein
MLQNPSYVVLLLFDGGTGGFDFGVNHFSPFLLLIKWCSKRDGRRTVISVGRAPLTGRRICGWRANPEQVEA